MVGQPPADLERRVLQRVERPHERVVSPAPRHPGLWFAFGHAHHGLTLGPVTGRLVADMLTGETPFVDPRPYRADRF